MHAFLDNGSWTEWKGQRIDGVAHPRTILALWQTVELEAAGLYEVEIDPVPDGKVATSHSLQDIDGRPVLVPSLADRVVTADEVKAEAQRRIITLFGVADLTSCIIKQMNANARATELTQIKFTTGLDAAQQAEADALQAAFDAVKAIRGASDLIEADDPIPLDYATDPRWP